MALTKVTGQVINTTTDLVVGVTTVGGGISATDAYFSGITTLPNTEDSTSTSTGSLIVSGGVGIAKNLSIGGSVSIGGTLTYEDVTNIDSVGLITARNGVSVTGGTIKVGSGITLSTDGDSYFIGITTFNNHVHLNDSKILKLGIDTDAQIVHTGAYGSINVSTGYLVNDIAGDWYVRNSAGSENRIIAKNNGAVELYNDNTKTFNTESWGNTSSGQILKVLAGEGTDATLQLVCDDGDDNADLWQIFADASHGGLNIQNYAAGSWETNIVTYPNSSVDLNYDNALRLKTSSTGITVTGEVAATQDYPNYRSTIDFNFTAVKKLDPRITYVRTGAASYIDEMGKVVLVGANVPRFDHDPVTRECKGLLIEPSRTNIFASSDAGNSVWVVDNSMTKGANSTDTKDPAGTYTACKLMSVASAGSSSQIYDQTSQSSGGVISVWAKKGTHNVLGIYDFSGGAGGIRAWFDLNTGEHQCEGGFKVAAGLQSEGDDTNDTWMIEYPNGWYRCIYYESSNMTYAFFRICDFASDTEASASSNSIYLWGLQGEVNVTYATSHIPCNTGSMPGTITRGTDFAYLDGTAGTEFDDIYRTDEGTFVLDWFNDPNGNHNDGYVFTIDDGTGNNRIGAVNSNSYQLTVAEDGDSQGNRDLGSINSGDNKMAFTYKYNDQATSLNGSDASVDTSCTIPTSVLKYWWIGLRQGQYDMLGGYVKRIVYYPTRLPNNQLKTLSS